MNRFYPVSLVLALAIVVVTMIGAGGRITFFLNLPSFLLVVVPAIVLSLGNYSLSEIGRCFAVGFRRAQGSRDELLAAKAFFAAVGRYIIASGILGMLVGIITMLALLGDDTGVGRGTAVALITALYALILYMIFAVPFQTGIERRLADLETLE